MKKLLYTLLAVSIIFTACKKEDEEPTNSGNNTSSDIIIGDWTFLESVIFPPPTVFYFGVRHITFYSNNTFVDYYDGSGGHGSVNDEWYGTWEN